MSIFTANRLTRSIASLAAVAGAVGAIGAVAPAAPASAQVMTTKTLNYADMPDIDQQRAANLDRLVPANNHVGLPGSGSQYCAPTAAMDAMAFLADHGMSSMAPGSRNWTLTGNYEYMTTQLNRMGQLMGTTATKGTSGSGVESGLTAWNAATGNHFGFVAEFPHNDGSEDAQPPNLGIAALTEAFGNPVMMVIGYYSPVLETVSGRSMYVLERTGGHVVAMTGFGDDGVSFRDPGDTANNLAPSAPVMVTQPVKAVTGVFGYKDSAGNHQLDAKPVTENGVVRFPKQTFFQLPGYAGGTAYVEGYWIVQPNFKLTAKKNLISLTVNDVTRSFKISNAGAVADVQLSPAGDSAYYSMKGDKTIYKLSLATGASTALAKVASPVTSIAVAPSGAEVFAAAGKTISAVSNTGTAIAKTTLSSTVSAVTVDPKTQQVAAVTAKSKPVTMLTAALAPETTVQLHPTSVIPVTTTTSVTPVPQISIVHSGIAAKPAAQAAATIVRRSQTIGVTGPEAGFFN